MKNLVLILAALFFLVSCKTGKKEEQTEKKDTVKVSVDPNIKALSDSIEQFPENADLLNRRANYYLQKNDQEKAFNDVKRMLAIDSTKARYFITYSDLAFMNNKTSESKRALEKAILLEPQNVDAHLKLAELYFYVRKYKESLSHLDKVIAIDKYNAKAYFLKGMDFKEVGDTNKAISSMETTIEQDPEYYNAWMQLGQLHAARGNPIAIDYYNGALKLNSRSTEALYGKAFFIQEQLRDTRQARMIYSQVLALDSTHSKTLYNLGYLEFVEKKDYTKALDYFMKSYRYDPEYADAVYMMGYCEEMLKRIPEAISDYRQALSIDKGHYMAAEALQRLGQKP